MAASAQESKPAGTLSKAVQRKAVQTVEYIPPRITPAIYSSAPQLEGNRYIRTSLDCLRIAMEGFWDAISLVNTSNEFLRLKNHVYTIEALLHSIPSYDLSVQKSAHLALILIICRFLEFLGISRCPSMEN
jgi:hypothetical protein